MRPRVIRTEADYETALARVEALMDAEPNTAEGEELDLWVTLIQLYEDKVHPIPLPDPIAAIRVRMEQAGLKQRDLIPYIGSASKVSEVLSGKRALSLPMMRRLREGLDIPAAVLLNEPGAQLSDDTPAIEWSRFPVAEMAKRGWVAFKGRPQAAREHAEQIMREFMTPFDEDVGLPMCARQHVRDGGKMDVYTLFAWKVRVMHRARGQKGVAPYSAGAVTQDFIRDVVRLSYFADGPLLAREYLAKSGIHLITERHLARTYLDGAALLMPDGRPVVALTLRYDRLDNFWFTLAHELAHVALHLDGDNPAFLDNLDVRGSSRNEQEADRLAADALIPRSAWKAAHLTPRSSPRQVQDFASALRISPAIPAGRIRYEADNHRVFSRLVGHRRARRFFEDA